MVRLSYLSQRENIKIEKAYRLRDLTAEGHFKYYVNLRLWLGQPLCTPGRQSLKQGMEMDTE